MDTKFTIIAMQLMVVIYSEGSADLFLLLQYEWNASVILSHVPLFWMKWQIW